MKEQNVITIDRLMWQIVEEKMSWNEAIKYVEKLNLDKYAGYNDWRLPTIKELENVVKVCGGRVTKVDDENWDNMRNENLQNTSYEDTYKKKGFNGDYYHSSTYDDSSAYGIDFSDGNSMRQHKTHNGYVKCVRVI